MRIKNVVQLSEFLKTRDELNERVYAICAKYVYSGVESWHISGDELVVDFCEGGTYHPAVRFVIRFPLTELFTGDTKHK